jgi:hypothetical protein
LSVDPTTDRPLPLDAMLRDAEHASALLRDVSTWDVYGDLCCHVRALVARVRELEARIDGQRETLGFARDALDRQSRFWEDPILARLALDIERCLAGPDGPANPEER